MNSYPQASVPTNLSLQQAYEYAEKLNTSSALCIEFGQYHRAEISLTKALHLAKLYNKETRLEESSCNHCTLDGCIGFTEESHRALKTKLFAKDRDLPMTRPPDESHVTDSSSDVSHSDSFVYKLAIRTPCLPVCSGHTIGPTLPLIITFNLALAKHLRAIDQWNQHAGMTTPYRRSLLERSFRLYEVLYNCRYNSGNRRNNETSHGNRHNNEFSEDLEDRFKIILCNNLCHVHRCLNGSFEPISPISPSEYKHPKYLEGLLSALMCVLQRKVLRTSIEGYRDDVRRRGVDSELHSVDHEGFWKTVIHLILTAQCAEAA